MENLKTSANKVVGSKQVLRALKTGALARVYVANDADTFLFQRVARAAEEAGVPTIRVATMKELGKPAALRCPPLPPGCSGKNHPHPFYLPISFRGLRKF